MRHEKSGTGLTRIVRTIQKRTAQAVLFIFASHPGMQVNAETPLGTRSVPEYLLSLVQKRSSTRRGGAGAVGVYRVREKLLDPVFPARCVHGANREGPTGAISASKVTRQGRITLFAGRKALKVQTHTVVRPARATPEVRGG